MRGAFVEGLVQLAESDQDIWLLTGDLGFGTLEPFRDRFPDRFINCGIAEQNMIGMATGLALSGKQVLVYSIANFPTFRCLEQIRNDVSYHNANVTIVAVGAGFTYGSQGYTHYAIEDLNIMSSFPNMAIVSPCDPFEVSALLPQILRRDGPAYLRLGRAGEPRLHAADIEPHQARLGYPTTLRDGSDATIVVTGGIASMCLTAADRLSESHGLSVKIVSFHTLQPLPETSALAHVFDSPAVLVVEEHRLRGGLGTTILHLANELRVSTPIAQIGVSEASVAPIGSREFMRNRLGSIEDSILQLMNRN